MKSQLPLSLPGLGTVLVQVVRSSRRTLGLEVKPDGQIIARLPRRVSNAAALGFLEDHRDWLAEKTRLARERQKRLEARPAPDYVLHPELEAQYRNQAREKLNQRAAFFASLMGVDFKRISVQAAKTRWGSCSAAGNLNFHWKLILMPPKILDYVVVHELAHRKEMNHSPRFWAAVEAVLPDYRERRKWLKEHGQEY